LFKGQLDGNFLFFISKIMSATEKLPKMPIYKSIVPCLFSVLFVVISISAAGAESVFPPHTLEASNARVENDILFIDTSNSQGVWNSCFRTVDTLFEPGKTYEIKFPCTIKDTFGDGYLLLLLRPLAANNHLSDAGFTEVYETPISGTVKFLVSLPESGPKQAFQIHTFKRVVAEIGKIQIREITRTFRAASDEGDIGGAPELHEDPVGSPDFTVEPPLPAKKVFYAKDYGMSEANPDNTEALQTAIWDARKAQPAKLVVEPGTYHFTSDDGLLFSTVFNLEFDGQGARFVFRQKKGKLVSIHHCERLSLKNFTIDWDWDKDPLASIVKVEEIADDNSWVDFRFFKYKDFPRKDLRIASAEPVHAATYYPLDVGGWSLQFEFYQGQGEIPRTEWREGNLVRMHASAAKLSSMKKGDTLRIRHYVYDMNGINMIGNKHLSLENVHIHSCPGMGMLVSGMQEYWQIVNCSVGPPEGSGRAIGSTADSMHVGSSRGRFRLENTSLGGFGDDTLNIHDSNHYGIKTGQKSITTKNVRYVPGNYYQIGDLIELRNDDFSPAGWTGKLAEIKRISPGRGEFEFVFEEEVPEMTTAGFLLFSQRYRTADIIIRNCRFENFPRGILISGKNITIENNSLKDGRAGGIKIETGYTMKVWSEGMGASNVVIRNNRFESVNRIGRYAFENRPDIYVSSYRITDPSLDKSDFPILRDILIEKNEFVGSTGSPVFLASSGWVTIRNNVFDLRKEASIKTDYRGGIGVVHSQNIVIEGNKWLGTENAGVFFDPESVKGLRLRK
jgi:hypothetical protein